MQQRNFGPLEGQSVKVYLFWNASHNPMYQCMPALETEALNLSYGPRYHGPRTTKQIKKPRCGEYERSAIACLGQFFETPTFTLAWNDFSVTL